jgi:hypothetical protein
VSPSGADGALPTKAPSMQDLARQLVARAAQSHKAPASAALTAFIACELTYRALARSIGSAGANALLARARSTAIRDHPLLSDLPIDGKEDRDLDLITAAIDKHGSAEAAAGLEELLEVLLTLLGRFVGIDLVVRLVAQSVTIGTKEHEDAS